MSPMQCAVALFLIATSGMIITDAARVLKEDTSPATVALGAAFDFTVLAYSTVTNAGASTVGGLLGVSPGFDVAEELPIDYAARPTLNGRASDADAFAAKADAQIAYDDAKDRTENIAVIDVVNIGGKTFTPGLYKTTGALEVSSGELTLSGKGVYIFQVAETLLMTTGLQMVLSNGALAEDIFWQVGSAATFEVSSVVVGNVMAYSAITLKTGATIEGRLFAMNAAVVLDGNVVTFPSLPEQA